MQRFNVLDPTCGMTMAPVRSMQVGGGLDSGERDYAAQRPPGNETWWDDRMKPNGVDTSSVGHAGSGRRRPDAANGRPPSASPSGGLPGNGRRRSQFLHNFIVSERAHMHNILRLNPKYLLCRICPFQFRICICFTIRNNRIIPF